jgi:hypothetical protein
MDKDESKTVKDLIDNVDKVDIDKVDSVEVKQPTEEDEAKDNAMIINGLTTVLTPSIAAGAAVGVERERQGKQCCVIV